MPPSADAAPALRHALFAQLAPGVSQALDDVLRAADRTHVSVYAVGGAVRDLLMERSIRDIDLAVEGDAIALARASGARRLQAHARFGTATIDAGAARLDLATTRKESYARRGALPRVAPAGIDADLLRRDFTVNAMALRLTGGPALLDPCGGAEDVRARRIRVLHIRSFLDDPTRMFRAFRYAARLGCEIEAGTRALMPAAIEYVPALSGARVRRELELLLGDDPPGAALEAASEATLLATAHPALRWNAAASRALSHLVPPRIVQGFALLAYDATQADAESIVQRLRLPRAEAAAVRDMAAVRRVAPMLRRPGVKPSGVVLLLERYSAAAIEALAAVEGDTIVGALSGRYLAEWRHVRPMLSGRDVQSLGIPEGPQVARGLQLIRAAKLDGIAADRSDEVALAQRFAASIRDAADFERHDA